LKESGSISDIVSHPSLSGNADLIFVNWAICFGFLHPLVPIHLN